MRDKLRGAAHGGFLVSVEPRSLHEVGDRCNPAVEAPLHLQSMQQ